MSTRGPVRTVAVVVAVAVAVAAAVLLASGGDGRSQGIVVPVIPATEATEPPPRFEPPRTERERLGRLLAILLNADTDDALWARGKLLSGGDEGRAMVVETARSCLTSNTAFVEHAFDALLVAPRIDDLPLAREGLRSADPEVVRRASLLLGKLGKAAGDAVPDLGATAVRSSHPVPHFACDALARIGGDAAVDELARVAVSAEAGPMARAHAILALGRHGGPRAVEVLRGLWDRGAEGDRMAAAEALITAGDRTPVETLRAAWTSRRDEVALILLARAADDVAFRALDARLRDPFESPVRRVEAITLLASFPADRTASLLRHVAQDAQQQRDVRVEAWESLVRAGSADDEAALLRMLRAEGATAQEDRYVAALVAGRLRRPEHGRALAEAARRDDSSAEVRTKLLSALALCGAAEGAETLVSALVEDASPHEEADSVAVNLGVALAAPPAPLAKALAPLVRDALEGRRGPLGPRAKFEVVVLAGRVCGSDVAPLLEKLLTDDDRHLRTAATRVLAYLHGPETERALRTAWWGRQDPYTRTAIAETLLRLSLDTPVR